MSADAYLKDPTDLLPHIMWRFLSNSRGREQTWQATKQMFAVLLLKYLSNDQHAPHDGQRRPHFSFTIPRDAKWDELSSQPNSATLARVAHAIEEANPNTELSSLFSDLGLTPSHQDPILLTLLVRELDLLDFRETPPENLGIAVDEFLVGVGEAIGFVAGEFTTPPSLTALLSELAAPSHDASIYDPACGIGSLLISTAQLAQATDDVEASPQIFGQDIGVEIAALARVNLLLHGIVGGQVVAGDSLVEPAFRSGDRLRTFDLVVSHLPFSVRLTNAQQELLAEDPFGRFIDRPQARIADWLFIQHAIASLNDCGRAVLAVPAGVLFRGGREAVIREDLVKSDLIESVISLPTAMRVGHSAPSAILVLNKNKPESMRGQILFIHSSTDRLSEHMVSDSLRARIVEALKRPSNQQGFAALTSVTSVLENESALIPARYVDLVGMDRFLGGSVKWYRLRELADVLAGTKVHDQPDAGGMEPVLRGRDISAQSILVDNLEMISASPVRSDAVYSQTGDILIQRIGAKPKAYLVDDAINGILVKDTVNVVRLTDHYKHLSRYLVEFLNSEKGQTLLSVGMSGSSVPTLSVTALKDVPVPIPDRAALEIIEDIHEAESEFLQRIDRARALRSRLFDIDDPDRVNHELRSLQIEARTLSASLVRTDDLDFQIRNFYPFPLAFAYRTVEAEQDLILRYREQLRVAENLLAFLGSLGLALAAHVGELQKTEDNQLSGLGLARCWSNGISPGHWNTIAKQCASTLLGNRDEVLADNYVSLWTDQRRGKESQFAKDARTLVELKNADKHDRGPKTPREYEEASNEITGLLKEVYAPLAPLTSHTLRLVQSIDIDWRTKKSNLTTLAYIGDHPGMRQETVELSEPVPAGHIYLDLTDDNMMSLYPLITVQHCPSCKTRETYMIDQWDGPGKRVRLKSFERGHTRDNDEVAVAVGKDFELWLEQYTNS